MPDGTRTAFGASHWGAFTAEAVDGRLVAVTPFARDPHPAPFLQALPDAVHAECRVARPAVRRSWLEGGPGTRPEMRGAEPFVEVSWDRALDLVAGELERVRAEYGNEAIYGSSGWGSAGGFHDARGQLSRFLNLNGGFVDQVTNYSFGAASVIVPRIVGSMSPVVGPVNSWPVIVEHTDLMVAFGGMPPKNQNVNQGGLGMHEGADWHRRAVEAGTEFVCVGPIRDDAGEQIAAEWHSIRPNTDLAVMLGLAHTLLAEGLHDAEFLARCCTGFDRLAAYLLGESDGIAKDAEWAAGISEMPAESIRRLARRMASSRTLIAVSWSVQRADHGEQPYWMTVALAAMLGQIGLPGGGFGFGYGAMHGIGAATRQVAPPKIPIGRNAVDRWIPVARLADMLLNPGAPYSFNGEDRTYPDIRLIYWCGGNPFHKQQDLNNLLKGWAKPETIIIHEPWWTPAAKRADIVLPCTTTLERNDIASSNFDRFVIANQRAIDPVGEARSEYDIYTDLAERLGFAEAFTEGRGEMGWLRHLYDVYRQRVAKDGIEMPGFDAFWEDGHFELPQPETPPIPFADFREDPEGAALRTPSGRIEIYSETIAGFGYDDVPGHPTWMEPVEWLGGDKAERFPLHMVSNQPRARLHSQLDCGSVSRGAKVAGREAMRMNPDDAAERGIADGDVARVFNDRGACLAGVVVSDAIRRGVIELATGAWFDPVDPASPGSLDKHGNPNVLTVDKPTSTLTQCCAAQTALVEVERFEGTPPEITAFRPPDFVDA